MKVNEFHNQNNLRNDNELPPTNNFLEQNVLHIQNNLGDDNEFGGNNNF